MAEKAVIVKWSPGEVPNQTESCFGIQCLTKSIKMGYRYPAAGGLPQ